VLGAVAVGALVLPTAPQLAAAESAFAGMLATGVALDRPPARAKPDSAGAAGKVDPTSEPRLDSLRVFRTN
jgi:hypothetical protein